MAQRMTGNRHRFPTAVTFSLGFESGFFSKATQQSIGIESKEIRGVAHHRVFEWSIEQAYVFKAKLLRLRCESIAHD